MRTWMTMNRVPVPDLLETIKVVNRLGDREIHIGTDGQKYGQNLDFVTCVAVLNPGKGGRLFYSKERQRDTGSLQHKLFTEVSLSIEIALLLCEVVHIEAVHVDANTNMKWDSAKYHKQLAGMVAGYGFDSVLKPDAWCASHAADQIVNHRNEPPRERRQSKKGSRTKR